MPPPSPDSNDIVYLVGDQSVVEQALAASGLTPDKKQIYRPIHTTEVVEMDESPVDAIRNKPDSSISVMCKLAAKGEADVVISAGNTRRCVAAAQLPDEDFAWRQSPGYRCNPSNTRWSSSHLRRWGECLRQAQAPRTIRDHGRCLCPRCLRHRKPSRRATKHRRRGRKGEYPGQRRTKADARRTPNQFHRQY